MTISKWNTDPSTRNLEVEGKSITDIWYYFRFLVFKNEKLVRVSDRVSLKKEEHDPQSFKYNTQLYLVRDDKVTVVFQAQNKDNGAWVFNHAIFYDSPEGNAVNANESKNMLTSNPFPESNGPVTPV